MMTVYTHHIVGLWTTVPFHGVPPRVGKCFSALGHVHVFFPQEPYTGRQTATSPLRTAAVLAHPSFVKQAGSDATASTLLDLVFLKGDDVCFPNCFFLNPFGEEAHRGDID